MRGMIHNNSSHLPGCPRPSIALQVKRRGIKTLFILYRYYYIHSGNTERKRNATYRPNTATRIITITTAKSTSPPTTAPITVWKFLDFGSEKVQLLPLDYCNRSSQYKLKFLALQYMVLMVRKILPQNC